MLFWDCPKDVAEGERGFMEAFCEAGEKPSVPSAGAVYVLGAKIDGRLAFKIGRTREMGTRMKALEIHLPFDVWVLGYVPMLNPVRGEMVAHGMARHARISGEWFALSPDELAELQRELCLLRLGELLAERAINRIAMKQGREQAEAHRMAASHYYLARVIPGGEDSGFAEQLIPVWFPWVATLMEWNDEPITSDPGL